MANVTSRRVVLVFMGFTTCRNLMLPVNLYRKYPDWTEYLKDPRASHFDLHLTSPIVWPGRLLENHMQLMVSN